MTRPTEILVQEHRIIARVLTCFELLLGEAQRSGVLHHANVERLLAFFQVFADELHQEKEELLLFPKLIELGMAPDDGPIEAMLGEHRDERMLLRSMREAQSTASSTPESLRSFLDLGFAFIELVRSHIAKEDRILFPFAEGLLDAEAGRELFAALKLAELGRRRERSRVLAEVNALCERYGVSDQEAIRLASRGLVGPGDL